MDTMIKWLLIVLALLSVSTVAQAQCTGVFPGSTVCGNSSGTSNVPKAVTFNTFFPTVTANNVFAGPTSGGPASPTFRLLVGADLPNPSATTLGGVQSKTAVANQFLNSISTTGVPTSAQPTFANISGTIASGQVSGSYTGITGVGTLTAGTWNATAITGTNIATNTVANNNLSQAGANTVHGNFTNAAANIANNPMPSCADTIGQHLNYVSGTGITCGTSSSTGPFVLLNTLTANNSATLSDTTSLTGAFNTYMIVVTNLVPSTNSTNCQLLIHSGGIFQVTGYLANTNVFNGTTSSSTATTTNILFCGSTANTTGIGASATIYISNPAGTTNNKPVYGNYTNVFSTGPSMSQGGFGGTWNGGTGAVDGFQISFVTGNMVSGTIKIYGIQ